MGEAATDQAVFPVVGIGASAGGLEALKMFFAAVRPDSGMAYVVVVHLAPDHDSNMAHLLSNICVIPIVEATDGLRIEADHGYVVPPGRNMRIEGGLLRLTEIRRTGKPLVVDTFFDSLAQELGSQAAAVILSGTGTDGSNGIKKIKAGEGIVFAQALETAGYTGMPKSAINTGVVDFDAAPEEIPEKLQQYFRSERSPEGKAEEEGYALSKIYAILQHQLGHDFSDHKETTLRRRLHRRMTLNEIDSYDAYVQMLRQNRHEAQALFREFLIGVTHFFRDPASFESLRKRVFPTMISEIGKEEVLRVWVAGCSTGEEAYSLAIALREAIDEQNKTIAMQIFATDLDEQAVETARIGVYPATIATDVSDARLDRFFHQDGNFYRVCRDIRESIIFSVHDLLSDPPFSRLHMVCCRNVLIYLKPHPQRRLIPLFHYTLNRGGIMVLGSSETIGANTALFSVLDQKHKIFRKVEVSAQVRGQFQFPTATGRLERALSAEPEDREVHKSTAELTQLHLLKEFTPTAALVEPDGRIIHIQGKTGKYLEAVTGPPTSNIVDLARPGLRLELASALRAVRTNDTTVVRREVRLDGVETSDPPHYVDIHIQPLSSPDRLAGRVLVVFQDRKVVPVGEPGSAAEEQQPDADRDGRIVELERELHKTRESHQSTVEELETANEELKSTNEELQWANEELQSTNEENESSKEELQALNEELQTANDQLEQKISELRAVNDDIRNLLNSTEVASIFVDEQIRVRRFTPEATQLVHLIDSDIGRPLADLVPKLEYDHLLDDVARASEDLQSHESDVRTTNGTWYRMRVVPYRTSDNRIDGAVLTFLNIDEQKRAEGRLEDARTEVDEAWAAVSRMMEIADEPLAILNQEQKIVVANDAFAQATGREAGELGGVALDDLIAQNGSSPSSWKALQDGATGTDGRTVGSIQIEGRGEYTLSVVALRSRDAAPGHLLIRLKANENV